MYRAASFTSNEIKEVIDQGVIKIIDLIALNIDEASMAADLSENAAGLKNERKPENIVQSSIKTLTEINPCLKISITAGKRGNWTWDGKRLVYFPAPEVEVISTAGAGDAFLAGIIAGIIAGLKLDEAQQLGTLTASLSVTSPHTINKDIDRKAISDFIRKRNYPVCNAVKQILF